MTDSPQRIAARDALNAGIERMGGMLLFAHAMGLKTTGAVLYWLQRGVPPARVIPVEKVTGVSRHILRPDIYPIED